MEFSLRRVNALFKKELKGLPKNKMVFSMCLLPIVFGIVYSNVFSDAAMNEFIGKSEVLLMCLSMNLVLVSSYIISMLIAEEKEKNTLRTLMLSGVAPLEFFAGKLLITFIISEISNIILFFIVGIETRYLGSYVLLTTLVVISMIGIGAAIGIIAPNQMATGIIGFPFLILIIMIPTFAMVNTTLKRVAEFLPNYNMKLIFDRIMNGETLGRESIIHVVVILVWIVISVGISLFAYHKVGLDK